MFKNYTEISEIIENIALIPVIQLDKAADAESLAQALVQAGLLGAEITFRTEAAQKSIAVLRRKYPGLLTGAGTVLTIDQVKAASDAGAQFIVSPGFNARIVDYCLKQEMPVFPGVNSPLGIEMALERGLNRLKFFPAEACGGLKMIKAMSAPYGHVQFMATGGISQNNLIAYLELPNVMACGGSWMVKPDLIKAGQFDQIEQLCRQAVQLIQDWRNK